MTNKEAVTVSRTATARVAQFFAMYTAYLEVASGEIGGLKPDEPILSFMGCGASDRLLVKDIEGFLKEQQEPGEHSLDKDRLDYLQTLTNRRDYTGKVVLRRSATGRGWRLHETNKSVAYKSVRTAIDRARGGEQGLQRGQQLDASDIDGMGDEEIQYGSAVKPLT